MGLDCGYCGQKSTFTQIVDSSLGFSFGEWKFKWVLYYGDTVVQNFAPNFYGWYLGNTNLSGF